MKSITKRVTYSAYPGEGGQVELVVEFERIHFVEEIIPDGQMAGMKGHREVPNTETLMFDLHPQEARMLWEQLGTALESVGRYWP